MSKCLSIIILAQTILALVADILLDYSCATVDVHQHNESIK